MSEVSWLSAWSSGVFIDGKNESPFCVDAELQHSIHSSAKLWTLTTPTTFNNKKKKKSKHSK